MIMEGIHIKKHRPKRRKRKDNNTIVYRENNNYSKCEEELELIFEDVSCAMDIVDEVKKRFPDDGDRKELLDVLEKCIHKKIDMEKENVNSLLIKYEIKERADKDELLDIIKQLEERREAILNNQESV